MKTLSALLLASALVTTATAADSIHRIPIKSLKGQPLDLSQFKGKVLLVVNVASECGYTPQYAGLQALYEKFRGQGLVVLGVPCNDFGGQEPGTPLQIEQFCQKNYHVTFPLTEKVSIRPGPKQHALYRALTRGGKPVGWNFEKFLVGKDGKLIQRFRSGVEPDDPKLVNAIKKALH